MDFAVPANHKVKLKERELKDEYIGGARGVMVTVGGYGHGDTSSNTLGKGMNPIILPPAMGK